MAVGQGSITVAQARTAPAAAPTVTGAAQGLSMNGTIVELGNASAVSALPQITVNRFIPIGSNVIQLNSNASATPQTSLAIGSRSILLTWTAGLNQPSIRLTDNTIVAGGNLVTLTPSLLTMQRINAGNATPSVQLSDIILGESNAIDSNGIAIAVTGATDPTITLTGNSAQFIAAPANVTNPSFKGTISINSAYQGVLIGNSNAGATASASIRVQADAETFDIVSYSNANAASGNPGGVDLIHTNASALTSLFRLVVTSGTGVLRATIGTRINLEFDGGGGIYTIGDVNSVVNGTTVRVEDVSSLIRLRTNNGVIFNSVAGDIWGQLGNSGLQLGVAGNNAGKLALAGFTSGTITIQTQAVAGTYNFNLPINSGSAGDILTSGGGGAAAMVWVAQSAMTGLPYIKTSGTSTLTSAITIALATFTPVTIANTGGTISELRLDNSSGSFRMRIQIDDAIFEHTTTGNFLWVNGSGNTLMTLTNGGRLSGTQLHNNGGAVTGTTDQYIASGTYTPTLTNVTNVAASTAFLCQWIRTGNVVTVSGKVSIDATAAGATELGMSLPIASNLATEQNLGGTAASAAAAALSAAIRADATNDRAAIVFTAVSLTNDNYFFTFTYTVL